MKSVRLRIAVVVVFALMAVGVLAGRSNQRDVFKPFERFAPMVSSQFSFTIDSP